MFPIDKGVGSVRECFDAKDTDMILENVGQTAEIRIGLGGSKCCWDYQYQDN